MSKSPWVVGIADFEIDSTVRAAIYGNSKDPGHLDHRKISDSGMLPSLSSLGSFLQCLIAASLSLPVKHQLLSALLVDRVSA